MVPQIEGDERRGCHSFTQTISGGTCRGCHSLVIFGVTPGSGQFYGFAVSVSDNDNSSQNLQESMVSSVSTRRFLNPTTWGGLALQ